MFHNQNGPNPASVDLLEQGIEDIYARADLLKGQADSLRQSGFSLILRTTELERELDNLRKEVAKIAAPAALTPLSLDIEEEEVFIDEL